MTIFADASAVVAIITGEPGADTFIDELQADRIRLCSALSAWEATAALCRTYNLSVSDARARVRRFLDAGRFQIVAIGEREFEVATDAYSTFGKGRHPAALNMGDCSAYACAKCNRAKLLYKGDDFAKTDLA